jgi:effector-binding domain-containing protein
MIEMEDTAMDQDIVLKDLPKITIASIRDKIPAYGEVGKLYGELFPTLGRAFVRFAGPPFSIYHDPEYRESDIDVEAAVPVKGKPKERGRIKVRELEPVKAACMVHKGSFESIAPVYQALMKWIDVNGYRISGPPREVHIKSVGQVKNPADYITEVQVPVEKA